MHHDDDVNKLKILLRQLVTAFCNRNHRLWKQPILITINELKEMNWPAVFFGGTLRSLIMSRLYRNPLIRPRDIDIVIQGVALEAIRDHFRNFISRETRFGGLKLQRKGWQFDVWPLERTWAFTQDSIGSPEFAKLPETTFFNLEAIAIEVWPKPGKPRTIYSGDDQFFHGIINRTLEINREDNPYPQLSVVRALLFAENLGFYIGPKLVDYILKFGTKTTVREFEKIQSKHYDQIRLSGNLMQARIQKIEDAVMKGTSSKLRIGSSQQLEFWEKQSKNWPHINIKCLSRSK